MAATLQVGVSPCLQGVCAGYTRYCVDNPEVIAQVIINTLESFTCSLPFIELA